MRRVTFREIDIACGALLAVLGGVVLVQSRQLDFYLEGIPGPGFFPSILAVVLTGLGVVLVVTRVRAPRESAREFPLPSRPQATRSLALWAAVLGATLLAGVLGFPLAMLLLVAVILFVIEGRRGIGAVATTIAIPLLAWLLFASLLQVPLPTGPFGS
ncbi:MAG: tripartite tricarboxylate transporter TctB family protein [Actinomycetes bacterium]